MRQHRCRDAAAERDLIAFHRLAAAWAARHVPDHVAALTTALTRALDVPYTPSA
ncbi:hypothetical protein [Actinomadura hallensis]|uniref:hypothetical protein n=1 Tax=Actinomadura hallensis TaxID=337895 RepID=UPI00163A6ACB|nr:hypothetical protein [Actinomadura hallensis]